MFDDMIMNYFAKYLGQNEVELKVCLTLGDNRHTFLYNF